ncbi:hypothetical protein DACRYDRAFT_17587 [Dacryopinax primogenitus]|uniref:Uncharacterized protein n=1 Tax=Dacryopinax primogenitus (strain DJM 731) TaxID=1858805 RepID=M5FTT2_DACPD|nr:uncharacterized protein DACRYDRAFT_17587 [Dacryopinax primogenitus]EJT98854.1 hypothetical protein DACRYDRAFT_17587 [Dacryopinax primogenitus]
MDHLLGLGHRLEETCYPPGYKVELADREFSQQIKIIGDNRTLLHDTLKRIHFSTVKKMLRQDIRTFLYREILVAEMTDVLFHMSKRHFVLKQWPHEIPLPWHRERIRNVAEAVALFWGIWKREIRIEKDNGEYHIHRVSHPKTRPILPTEGDGMLHITNVSPLPQTVQVLSRSDQAAPPALETTVPFTCTEQTSSQIKKRKRSKSEAQSAKLEPRLGSPPSTGPTASHEVIDLCSPPRKRERREHVKQEREESPEVQWLPEAPSSSIDRQWRSPMVPPEARSGEGKHGCRAR